MRQLEALMKLLILLNNRPLTGASHDALSTVQAATFRQVVPMVHVSENENAAATTPLMETKSSQRGEVCLQCHNKI